MSPFNRGPAELSIDTARVIDQLEEFAARLLGRSQGFTTTPIAFVGKIFRERRSSPADAKAPAFEGGRLICESGQILAGF